MKPARFALALAVCFFAGWLPAASLFALPITIPVISTFDLGCDGWTGNMTSLCDQDGTPSVGVSWIATGGNPAGNLQFNEGSSVQAPDTRIVAPAKFLGDWSALDGVASIQYDHTIINSGLNNGRVPRAIYLSGGGSSATWSGPLVPAGNFLSTPWETFTASLSESDWTVTGSWTALLSSVESFEIQIDHYSSFVGSAETHRFDNILLIPEPSFLVPEPSMAVLLLIGLLVFAGYRRSTSRAVTR